MKTSKPANKQKDKTATKPMKVMKVMKAPNAKATKATKASKTKPPASPWNLASLVWHIAVKCQNCSGSWVYMSRMTTRTACAQCGHLWEASIKVPGAMKWR